MSQQAEAGKAGTVVFVFLSGAKRGQTVPFKGGGVLRVGYSPSHDIQLSRQTPPPRADPDKDLVAELRPRGNGYLLQAAAGRPVWVNGEPVQELTLVSGDLLELGDENTLLRFRRYGEDWSGYKSVQEALSDCIDCARRHPGSPLKRSWVLAAAVIQELSTQVSPWLRLAMLGAIGVLFLMAFVLWSRSQELERRLRVQDFQLRGMAELLRENRRSALSVAELRAIEATLEKRLSESSDRIRVLEDKLRHRSRIIEESLASVVFVQGEYGFLHIASNRPLRLSKPLTELQEGEMPSFTLEGEGPLAEVFFTGTAFVAAPGGHLLTNRHVAEPWQFEEQAQMILQQEFRPLMHRFQGYLPRQEKPFPLHTVAVSSEADLALLRAPGIQAPPLRLAETPPRLGDEVVLLGYPAGIQALVARASPDFVHRLSQRSSLDFWEVGEELAKGGYVAPLVTVGVVGQISPSSLVYDAETTHGGSGGPVLGPDGRVVAINSAVIPEFGGSNIGVRARKAAALLQQAGIPRF